MHESGELEYEKDEQEIPISYKWCLHCERAYKQGEYRLINGVKMCPYDGCQGDAVIDAWNLNKVKENHTEYPEIPEIGKEYSLY